MVCLTSPRVTKRIEWNLWCVVCVTGYISPHSNSFTRSKSLLARLELLPGYVLWIWIFNLDLYHLCGAPLLKKSICHTEIHMSFKGCWFTPQLHLCLMKGKKLRQMGIALVRSFRSWHSNSCCNMEDFKQWGRFQGVQGKKHVIQGQQASKRCWG